MTTILVSFAISVVAGLLVSELTDIAPRLAGRIVGWAAYRWSTDPEMAEVYAEAWLAVLNDRPGRLFKLLTAFGFAGGAIGRAVPRHAVAIIGAFIPIIIRALTPIIAPFGGGAVSYVVPVVMVGLVGGYVARLQVTLGPVSLETLAVVVVAAYYLGHVVKRSAALHRGDEPDRLPWD